VCVRERESMCECVMMFVFEHVCVYVCECVGKYVRVSMRVGIYKYVHVCV
jgi:hypothetical protein